MRVLAPVFFAVRARDFVFGFVAATIRALAATRSSAGVTPTARRISVADPLAAWIFPLRRPPVAVRGTPALWGVAAERLIVLFMRPILHPVEAPQVQTGSPQPGWRTLLHERLNHFEKERTMLRASFLLLAILLSLAASQRPPVPAETGAAQKLCNCDTQCGVCGGRLRGCFNGHPICECFQC